MRFRWEVKRGGAEMTVSYENYENNCSVKYHVHAGLLGRDAGLKAPATAGRPTLHLNLKA
jgi:hypothetical protein